MACFTHSSRRSKQQRAVTWCCQMWGNLPDSTLTAWKKKPTFLVFILQNNLANTIVVFLFLQTCHDENSHTTAQLPSAWPREKRPTVTCRELRVTFPDRFKVLPSARKTNIYLCHIDEWRGAVILPHFSSSSQPGVKVHAGASEENICVSLWSVSLL